VENLLGLTLDELSAELKQLGGKSFQAKQIFKWLHKRLLQDFDRMTDLSRELREQLKTRYTIALPRVKKVVRSADQTRKYLFELEDGQRVEAALMQTINERKTVCISTQVGCPLSCTFCATGQSGFKRNLTTAEIIGQVYQVARDYPDLSNVVYMGMGEPFLNYDNVVKSLRILITPEGANFGQRRLAVSTCGIPDKICAFSRENFQVRLAVSLNSPDSAVRSQLMPINKKYPLNKLMESVKYYLKTTGRRITFEYVMLAGINDRTEDAEKLARLCRHLNISVNLIVYNKTASPFHPSSKNAVDRFVTVLQSAKIVTAVRRSRGGDIAAACGQLATKN
jgi:23S rRNA (adenine2503-C2)-methyltransferase